MAQRDPEPEKEFVHQSGRGGSEERVPEMFNITEGQVLRLDAQREEGKRV